MSNLKNNKYSKMQKDYYNDISNRYQDNKKETLVWDNDTDPIRNDGTAGEVVGLNEFFNSCEFLFNRIDNHDEKVALDFGCGPGRNISLYSNLFSRIDGVDICDENIDFCRKIATKRSIDSIFYNCNGYDLSEIERDTYDVVMSFITLQHICVYDIRLNYLKEFNRVLKSGGLLEIQMGYGDTQSPDAVSYFENYYEAETTNGGADVIIKDPQNLIDDLESAGFEQIEYTIETPRYFSNHDDRFIFVSAFKN